MELIVVIGLLIIKEMITGKYFKPTKYDKLADFLIFVVYIISKSYDSIIGQCLFFIAILMMMILMIVVRASHKEFRVISLIVLLLVLLLNSWLNDIGRSNIDINFESVSFITNNYQLKTRYIVEEDEILAYATLLNNIELEKTTYSYFRYYSDRIITFYNDDKEELLRIHVIDDYHLSDGIFKYKSKEKLPQMFTSGHD